MDKTKCAKLIAAVKERGYSAGGDRVLVNRSEFFNGNDDPGSIGCNLLKHPGVDAFDAVFRKIEAMDGVAGVYLAITEIDETSDNIWPFSDTALIVTRLSPTAFESVLRPLEPDEAAISHEAFANPPAIPQGHQFVYVWWD